MKEISATEAARNFSAVLDAVEHHDEQFVVRRGGRAVARIGPAGASSGAALKSVLRKSPLDRAWSSDLRELRALLTREERDWSG